MGMTLRLRPHMKLKKRDQRVETGFTLIEALISTAIVGIFFVALYTGIAQGFGLMTNARENLRANQILVDKMEEMKLYSWDQLTSFGTQTSFIPTNFTEEYYPSGTNLSVSTTTFGTRSISNTGANAVNFRYYGAVLITNVAFTNTAYATNMRKVVIAVAWTNGVKPHRHEMTTYVSEYGMQKYIY